jgi:hypothetical protein
MEAAQDAALSVLLVVLTGVLMFLRVRYPNASRRSETAVLIATVLAVFGICNALAR